VIGGFSVCSQLSYMCEKRGVLAKGESKYGSKHGRDVKGMRLLHILLQID
jgi:hypothetical protein